MLCSDLPDSHRPLVKAAAPRSGHWYQNLWEGAAAKSCQHRLEGICPAAVCKVRVPVVWAAAALDTLLLVEDRVLFPEASAFAGVAACFDPAHGFCESCHRVVEYTGYTWSSPGQGKIDALTAEEGRGDPCHSGGAHGIFQLLDPLVA